MNGQVVLITGTNSGFGLEIAIQLAERGYVVIATMRNTDKKELLLSKARVRKVPTSSIDVQKLDVTKQSDIDNMYRYISSTYGKLDILINNAGFSQGGVMEEVTVEQWREQFETNLFGLASLTKSYLPMMRNNRAGKIINLGSISGRIGLPGLGPYAASKFALAGLSESLRLELKPFNVYISLIEAGSFKTDIWKKGLEKAAFTDEKDYESLMQSLHNHMETVNSSAQDPDDVIKVVVKICQTKKPRFRYQVGKGVKGMAFLKSILPWAMVERVVLRILKHQNKKTS